MIPKKIKLKFNPTQKTVLDIYENQNRKIKIIGLVQNKSPSTLYRYYGLNVGDCMEIKFDAIQGYSIEYSRISIRNIKFDKQILIG